MKNLREKLKKQGGFTLIEMLIVVAIIAILIAIAIPTVSAALERAREATDMANERAALGLAYTEVMANNKLGNQTITDQKVTAFYVVTESRGELKAGATGNTSPSTGCDYGKGTEAGDVKEGNAGKGIAIIYTPANATGTEEKFEVQWVAPGEAPTT